MAQPIVCASPRTPGICWYCGEEATTRDHVTPRSRGGTDDPENLVPACVRCNSQKRDKTLEEYRAWKYAHRIDGYHPSPYLFDYEIEQLEQQWEASCLPS